MSDEKTSTESGAPSLLPRTSTLFAARPYGFVARPAPATDEGAPVGLALPVGNAGAMTAYGFVARTSVVADPTPNDAPADGPTPRRATRLVILVAVAILVAVLLIVAVLVTRQSDPAPANHAASTAPSAAPVSGSAPA